MEPVLFTIAAVALYFLSDWILVRIEIAAGHRLEYRTLVFFAIIVVLAVSSFSLIRLYFSGT